MNWKDEDILEWYVKCFPNDPQKQIEKVCESLLNLEKAKRGVFMSQSTNYQNVYWATADVIIACIGLKRYQEYAALARAVYAYVEGPHRKIIRPWINQRMDFNIKT